jgi:hypothetical protein
MPHTHDTALKTVKGCQWYCKGFCYSPKAGAGTYSTIGHTNRQCFLTIGAVESALKCKRDNN